LPESCSNVNEEDLNVDRQDGQQVVVDADAHVIEPRELWNDYLEDRFRERGPRFAPTERGLNALLIDDQLIAAEAFELSRGASTVASDRPATRHATIGGRLADMESEGITAAVLFPTIGLYLSEVRDPALLAALCRAYNNWLADQCAQGQHRLYGAAMLPLSDIDAAVTELERVIDRDGAKAVMVRPNPANGRSLHHPAYDRLWARAAEADVAVAVHEGWSPGVPTLGSDRFTNSAILHAISHPFEQMAACAGLILTGVLERHPALRVGFLESGGGWVPFLLHRMDEHFEMWPSFLSKVKLKPSEYFARQCFVSIDPQEPQISAIVEAVGDECIVWATDYPHADSVFPGAVDVLRRGMEALSPASQERILATNAQRYFGIKVPVGA
jgi:predicted TIM-barrel fold metal-dependent hydrolase